MRGFHFLLGFSLLVLVSILGDADIISKHQAYIVYMGSSTSPQGTPRSDLSQLLIELVKRNETSILQIYNKSFSGCTVRLSEAEAKSIAQRPGVVSVFPDSTIQLHTTRSWDFLRTQNDFKNFGSTRTSSRWSERDTIIGFIDTGIWPDHPSFDDTYTGPVPQRWKGICMNGTDNSTSFKCNRKVIGMRYYDLPDTPGSITSAMDEDGHGTHVASIGAGMPVHGASYYGFAKGVARGGSPNSRIAAYRICGYDTCSFSGTLKAFDDAIADGVDLISISLGFSYDLLLYNDPISIGAFHAVEKGVIVVASAGNDGPSPETVKNCDPWMLSVGASTMDRDFQTGIVLSGRKEVIKGGGITLLNGSAVYPLVDGRMVPVSSSMKGKMVLCEYDICQMIADDWDWIIFINDDGRQGAYPTKGSQYVPVSEADGARIRSYINSTRNPSARILPTVEVTKNYKPAPVVAVFSSRGPAPRFKNLIKPDVTAPGVGVLAAWRFNDTSEAYPGMEPPLFNLLTGTSMSCPHVSALAAIVKSWHPTWKPSAIKSAIMTTAIPTNNYNAPITTSTGSRATPYDMGSGEISTFDALWPGLVYETDTIEYILSLCNMGYNTSMIKLLSSTLPDKFACPSNSTPDLISDLNYPSIAVSGMITNVTKTVKRTVTNVGQVYSAYKVIVESPAGVLVQVYPNKLKFTNNVKKLSFRVTFRLTASSPDHDRDLFGSITWSNNFHNVRSPFVVSKA